MSFAVQAGPPAKTECWSGVIRIGSNVTSLSALRNLAQSNERLGQTFEKLASGRRINRASDDPASLAVSGKLNVASKIYAQGVRNVNDAISITAVAKSALTEIEHISMRQQELAQQAANGTYSRSQREALDKEARSLTDEYNRILQTTKFNDRPLFASNWESIVIQAGEGNSGTLSFKLGDDIASKISPGSYFQIYNPNGVLQNFWFAVDGQGTGPAVGGNNIRIDLSTLPSTVEAADFTFQDPSTLAGTWFYINSPTTDYYVWFDSGGDPDPEMATAGLRIDISAGSGVSSADDVAAAVAAALQDTGEFTVQSVGGATIRASTKTYENVWDAYDENSGTDIKTVQNGSVQRITASAIAEVVRATFQAYGMSAVLEDSTTLKITNGVSGNYIDLRNVSSNIIVNSVVQGTGLTTYAANNSPQDVKLADLNNDGYLDLLSSGLSGGLGVRLGNSGGTFGALRTYGGGYCYKTEAMDLNGDGYLDMAVSDWLGTRFNVFLNNGDGTFGNAVVYSHAGTFGIASGDFDSDGHIDLMISSQSQNATLSFYKNKGDGSGTFNAPVDFTGPVNGQRAIVAADFNGDQKLDLATSGGAAGQLTIWANNGSASFTAVQTFACSTLAWTIAAADLNGDGAADLLYGPAGGGLDVRMNDRTGSFGAAVNYAMGADGITTADLNGDGRLDIASTGGGSTVGIGFNAGNGTFGAPTTYTMGTTTRGVFAADLDNDGAKDLCVADQGSSSIRIRLNNGNGTFIDPRGDQKEVTRISFGDGRGRTDIAQLDLTTVVGARAALDTLEQRLTSVRTELGTLGANESRLETAVGTLRVARENFEAAASRITDVDVAQESAGMIRQSILQQVGSSILAQANQTPGIALLLLK